MAWVWAGGSRTAPWMPHLVGDEAGPPRVISSLSHPHLFCGQSLKTEVSQLQRALQRAETEAKVLWEEVRDQQLPADTSNVQEKVWLRQEVRLARGQVLGVGEGGGPAAAPHQRGLAGPGAMA